MVTLKCRRCKEIWDYKGQNKTTAMCPDCRFINKIAETAIIHKEAKHK